MTNRRTRQPDRAVRDYQRTHPGTTLPEARDAVAARSHHRPALPARIPAAPLPRPADTLTSYVKRVAQAVGVERHRAMELLGLAPGASATERLAELASHLDDHTVRALTAATGMTAAQAHALTTPLPARPDVDAVRRMTEANFAPRHFQRGGKDKTSSAGGLEATLALNFASRDFRRGGEGKTKTSTALTVIAALARRGYMIDPDPAPTLDSWTEPDYRPVIPGLPWTTDDTPMPVDPALAGEILKKSGAPDPTDQPDA